MKSFGKAALNTIIGLSIAVSVNAQWSKTSQQTITTKDTLIENIDNTPDKETADIMKMIGWFSSKQEIEKILVDNGMRKTDSKYIVLQPDTILYETIQELQKKYGNVKISFTRPKSIDESYDGHFSKRKNTIQIHLKNIIENIKNSKNCMVSFQGEMLDIKLMEMSHKKQDITFKKKWNDFRTFIKVGFDYDEMYDTEGTIENEAHEILEPQIINEFLEIYASKIDTTNTYKVGKADFYFERYEYTNKDLDKTNANLQFMLNREDERDLSKMKTRK